MNVRDNFEISKIDNTMCPNQLYGVTKDETEFYFRGRSGIWELRFGESEELAIWGPGFSGFYNPAGWLKPWEWEHFFWIAVDMIASGFGDVEEGYIKVFEEPRPEGDLKKLVPELFSSYLQSRDKRRERL